MLQSTKKSHWRVFKSQDIAPMRKPMKSLLSPEQPTVDWLIWLWASIQVPVQISGWNNLAWLLLLIVRLTTQQIVCLLSFTFSTGLCPRAKRSQVRHHCDPLSVTLDWVVVLMHFYWGGIWFGVIWHPALLCVVGDGSGAQPGLMPPSSFLILQKSRLCWICRLLHHLCFSFDNLHINWIIFKH